MTRGEGAVWGGAGLLAAALLLGACVPAGGTAAAAPTPVSVPAAGTPVEVTPAAGGEAGGTRAPATAPEATLATATPVEGIPLAEERGEASPAQQSGLLHGVGILGDSFYDEYQGTDARGGQYHDVTFNLVELLARNRPFYLGPWGDWSEPRRTGYAFNWARSGATSKTMIEMGQHTGVAAQIAAGDVTFVFIGIGANDFSPFYGDFYERIYSGAMSDEELEAKIAKAIADVTLAVDTVQQAGAQGVAMTLFTQWELDPTTQAMYPDASRRQRVAKAIDEVNAGLAAMAAERRVAVVDQIKLGKSILPQLDTEGFLDVGGERIDFLRHGDEPHHSRLADSEHLGTVISGLTANYYFVDTLNQSFGQAVAPLSDEEILHEAGLRP